MGGGILAAMPESELPPGIAYPAVARFFRENVPGADGDLAFMLIGEGRSNLTYAVTCGGQKWVMRRPPLGHVLPTAHDMVREYRVISAMDAQGFPVAHPIALCEDPAVNEYPFYVMSFADGRILTFDDHAGYAETEPEREKIGHALVDTLVQLHAIDYQAAGLGDFAFKPEGYLERQLRRWGEQWERSKTRDLPEVDELSRRLRKALPPSPPPTLVHGDYRLGNMVLAHDDPGRVVALLDWEMSTLGDPLSDLGYTIMYWGQEGDPELRLLSNEESRVTARPGFLSRDELVAEYARKSGRSVEHIEFYEIFANYKIGIIMEGIHARYLAGETVGDIFDDAGEVAAWMLENGLAVADRASNPVLRGE